MTTIYLAGKISKNDWRSSSGQLDSWDFEGGRTPSWIGREYQLEGFLVVGPFFTRCDHGCAHYTGTHATAGCGEIDDIPARSYAFAHCLEAIRRCDVFFAWLDDDLTAYGTLVEIGYALSLGKRIYIGTPIPPTRSYDGHGHVVDATVTDELWFAFQCGRIVIAPTPAVALKEVGELERTQSLHGLCESPIEKSFWQAHCERRHPELDGLTPQHVVGRYRLDFAIPARKIAIELDGYEYHSGKDQFVNDRIRQRDLEALGWYVIRFAGSEVFADAHKCVEQAARLAGARR